MDTKSGLAHVTNVFICLCFKLMSVQLHIVYTISQYCINCSMRAPYVCIRMLCERAYMESRSKQLVIHSSSTYQDYTGMTPEAQYSSIPSPNSTKPAICGTTKDYSCKVYCVHLRQCKNVCRALAQGHLGNPMSSVVLGESKGNTTVVPRCSYVL